MTSYLYLWTRACVLFPWRLLRAVPAEGWRKVPLRLLLFALILPVFLALNAMHLLGALLDELFFFRYRQVRVEAPLFILGIPRSGTTFLHRVLAGDTQFTTLRTWEVLFAPSISERYFFRTLGHLLSPLGQMAAWLRRRLLRRMDAVHLFGLMEAEEDFFLWLWLDHCFLQAFVCPQEKAYWQLGNFAEQLPQHRQQQLLDYYERCLQKHLYFHGPERRLLSKNPSFTSLLPTLLARFPDAGMVLCSRPPWQVVPSQLSSLRPVMRVLGKGQLQDSAQARLLRILHGYYALLRRYHDHPRCITVSMSDLHEQLAATVEQLYPLVRLSPSEAFRQGLQEQQLKQRNFRTRHRYALTEFSLKDASIRDYFEDVWPLDPTPAAPDGSVQSHV